MSRARWHWMHAGCAALALVTVPAAAQEPASPDQDTADTPSGQVVTVEARAVLDRMASYLNGLERFEITMQGSRDEVLPFGYKLQNNETARMVVQRPNRFRIDVDGDIKHRSYYYDGSTLTMVAPDEGVYARTQAPDTIGGVINGLLNAGVEMPMVDVLRQGFEGTLLDGVRYGLVVGETPLDGADTDHLAFRQPTIDWQMWVAKDGQPRKLLITTRYEVGDPQYQATMRWNLKPRIDAKTFSYTPSKDMQEVKFYTAPAAEGGTAGGTP